MIKKHLVDAREGEKRDESLLPFCHIDMIHPFRGLEMAKLTHYRKFRTDFHSRKDEEGSCDDEYGGNR